MNKINKLKDWILLKITSRIIIEIRQEINNEISKQNEDILMLLKEEFAIIKEQNLSNTKQIIEISKQLDVLGRTLRGKGFN